MYLYWLWLALLDGLSLRDKLALLELAGNPEDLYYADQNRLAALTPDQKRYQPLLDKSLDAAEAVNTKCSRLGIRILPIHHPDYPECLRSIQEPPLVLYCKGQLPDPKRQLLVGVVGTRKASLYGIATARKLGQQLGAHGAVVVSGMAAGIDTAATQGALTSMGYAVGVLGCGIDVIFPRSNRELYGSMGNYGCLISEYPPGSPPLGWHFPLRNRIISGLSQALVVVEAPEKSGALITARHALEQGRDVFAVPGNLDNPNCVGSNQLMREGAGVVTCAWDIVREYQALYPTQIHEKPTYPAQQEVTEPIIAPPKPIPKDLDPNEQLVLSNLATEDRHIDTLAAQTGLSTGDILSALTMLEIKGYAVTQPGGWAKLSENH